VCVCVCVERCEKISHFFFCVSCFFCFFSFFFFLSFFLFFVFFFLFFFSRPPLPEPVPLEERHDPLYPVVELRTRGVGLGLLVGFWRGGVVVQEEGRVSWCCGCWRAPPRRKR